MAERRSRRRGRLLVAVLAASAVVFSGRATASRSTTAGMAPDDPAPTVQERPDLLDGQTVDQIMRIAARSLSQTATETWGPWSAAKAAATGQSNYFTVDDVEVFVVESSEPSDHSYVFVPEGSVVRWDGSIVAPEDFMAQEDGTVQASDPTFGGPWGAEYVFPATYWSTDDGGFWCNTTVGANRSKWIRRPLSDSSSYYDYRGISQIAVAEITEGADNCNDYIDTFSIGMRSNNTSGEWLAQAPLSDYSSGCSTTTLSLSGTFGGVGASISQPITRCEYWDVQGGNAGSASTWYQIVYDNRGVTSNESRESASVAVLRIRQGNESQLVFSNGLDVDND